MTDSPSIESIPALSWASGEVWPVTPRCEGRTELMFADDADAIAEAKQLCATCPLRGKCLTYALDRDIAYGVWGGLSFEERTRRCPVCFATKEPSELGCCGLHSLLRLARLMEQEVRGDESVSVARVLPICAPTSPACPMPRGRSHSTSKAYRMGCKCAASRLAFYRERDARLERPKPEELRERSTRERFMSFVSVDDQGHWWWTGSKNGSGYGNFWDGSRVVRAHFFAYREFVAEIPSPFRLRNVAHCGDRRCISPYHHEAIVLQAS